MSTRNVSLVVFTLLAWSAAWLMPAMPQPPEYHAFADTRAWLGIPNFLDAASNIGFLVVGLLGLWIVSRPSQAFEQRSERLPYAVFFIGVVLTACGSFQYHVAPDNERLFWDRLPMTIAFMSLIAAQIGDRIHVRGAVLALAPLLALGVLSVLHWRTTERMGAGNVIPFAVLQGYTVAILLLLTLLYPSRYTRGNDLYLVFAWYAIAKLLELFDRQILELGGIVSGHSLKHLAAAMGCGSVCRMLMRRERRVAPLLPRSRAASPLHDRRAAAHLARMILLGFVLSAGLAPVAEADDSISLDSRVLALNEGALSVELQEASIENRKLYVIRAQLPARGELQVRALPSPAPLAVVAQPTAHVAINGGFYNDADRPMGLVVEDGKTVSSLRKGGGSGVFLREASGFRVVHRDRVPPSGVLQALQSIDRIVDRGAALVAPNASPMLDARSAVATYPDRSARLYVVFAAEAVESKRCDDGGCVFTLNRLSSATGVSLSELARFLVREGAEAALNLDGGYSTSFEARLSERQLRVVAYGATINALVARP